MEHTHQHHKSDPRVKEGGKQTTAQTHPSSHGSGHAVDKHAGHHTADFLRRFWICLVLSIPILLLSHMIQQWLGFEWRFPGDKYVLFGISTLVYFYGGWPFLTGAIREIRGSAIGMMTLVALAISVSYFYSVAVVFGLTGMDFFWELARLILLSNRMYS